MKRTRIGTASTDARLRERPPETLTRAALARKKPMNIDPLSPMKIDAGWEL